MLRAKTKAKINSIFELQHKLHRHSVTASGEVLTDVLEDCQQAAIAAGRQIEKELPERTDLIELLEQYCEALYQLSVQPEQKHILTEKQDRLLENIEDALEQLPAGYQAVFMPYKAEMWDSLESVWMAFDQDENCEALVVPLPYSKYESEAGEWKYCYEGDRFPAYVPVTDYHTYLLEEEYPEYIFIHNAYDEYNRVTRIDPAYFSVELKKYTKNLVYIPYYLTGGSVAEDHKMLSAYRYMDYMIVQSELFKSGFEGASFYDKILPLGSPKLDRVIRMCQKDRQIPDEWKATVGYKKCVMLNTSLGYFLHYGKYYLRRIRLCIDWLKDNPIVALIWRPHPLFESTIRSMRPELLAAYRELITYFLESGIGVLDQTPDITRTIAAVDAYIGDRLTSVINLFGAAGRPMFILDAEQSRPYTRKEQRRISIGGLVEADGKLWITPRQYNGLLCADSDWNKVELIHRFEGQPKWSCTYIDPLWQDCRLYLNPVMASNPVCYSLQTGEESTMSWKANGKALIWYRIFSYKNSLYYIPLYMKDMGIYEYNCEKKCWTVYNKWRNEWIGDEVGTSRDLFVGDAAQAGQDIWLTGNFTNRVLQFDMERGTYRVHAIGPKHYGYIGICRTEDALYLAERHGMGKLIEVREDSLREYLLPNTEAHVWKAGNQNERAVGPIFDFGNYLILAPGYSDRMWRFEKATGKFTIIAESFWEEAAADGENYVRPQGMLYNFIKAVGEQTLWVQRLKDDAILILNVETGNCEVKYMYLSEKALAQLTDGQDGFQKEAIDSPFVCTEGPYFSFEDFIRKVANGELEEAKKRQKEELTTLAANMDGTCGESVYTYLRNN